MTGDCQFLQANWGSYRSLNNTSCFRDKELKFADFCIAKEKAVCQ
jgi:hypothetical protein